MSTLKISFNTNCFQCSQSFHLHTPWNYFLNDIKTVFKLVYPLDPGLKSTENCRGFALINIFRNGRCFLSLLLPTSKLHGRYLHRKKLSCSQFKLYSSQCFKIKALFLKIADSEFSGISRFSGYLSFYIFYNFLYATYFETLS